MYSLNGIGGERVKERLAKNGRNQKKQLRMATQSVVQCSHFDKRRIKTKTNAFFFITVPSCSSLS